MLIALASLKKGLGKLALNPDALKADLERNWAVVAEGIQTILRSVGYPNPYEALKALTRTGKGVDEKTISEFIDSLDVSPDVKQRLHALRPDTYLGY
jgi:adenylosuccinate lyase